MGVKKEVKKRDHEIRIQGWFDTENPSHLYVLQVFEWYKADRAMNQQQVIEDAIYALAERDGVPVPRPESASLTDSKLNLALSKLDALMALIKSGGVSMNTPQAAATVQQIQDEYDEELTPM